MRKIILSLMAVAGLVMFNGCAKPDKKTYDEVEFNIWPAENNSFKISGSGNKNRVYSKDYKSYNTPIKRQLRLAAEETKKRGYSYFVLLNAGVNNINGFPINSYKELVRYVTLRARKDSFQVSGRNQDRGDTPIIDVSSVRVWFKPVGAEYKNSYISVWSVEQTLRDTQ